MNEESKRAFEELHLLLASLSLAFWRMRLLVERQTGVLPLQLLILSVLRDHEGLNPKGA